ncbi:hypothetical protein TNCV_2005841 [Trichonephila clavipes]|nr:hypothetical protein TNCV_2005841 [Trichonephila clavipes]
MLNDDEIVTSMQAESYDDETDEDEGNNNESSKERSGDLAGQCNTFTPKTVCWVKAGYEGAHYSVEKHALNDVYKSQCNSLNHQTEVQVSSQGV